MTISHLKNQKPFCKYDLGSLLLQTHNKISDRRKKNDATAIHTRYTAKYPTNWLHDTRASTLMAGIKDGRFALSFTFRGTHKMSWEGM
jgi:hypothetical protein